jgi:hypothetical protein
MAGAHVVEPGICCRLIATGVLALALAGAAWAQEEKPQSDKPKPNRIERTAKKAADATERTARRAGKFVEKTATRAGKFVEDTAKRTENAVRRAVE